MQRLSGDDEKQRSNLSSKRRRQFSHLSPIPTRTLSDLNLKPYMSYNCNLNLKVSRFISGTNVSCAGAPQVFNQVQCFETLEATLLNP